MAKGQRRSNREQKKPKQSKPDRNGTPALPTAPVPAIRERTPVGGRGRIAGRNGRA